MKPFAGLCVMVVCCFLAGSAFAERSRNLVVNGDFEQGLEGWKTFSKSDPKTRLSPSTESHQGKHSLKIETTAKRRHEGVRTQVKGLEPENIYIISAYAKGFGYCALFAFDGKWTYGPRQKLTDQWQKVEIKKFVTGKSMSLSIVSDANYEKAPAVFYIDDVQVVKAKSKVLPNAEVKPVLYEAESFAVRGKHVKIVNDASASGGAYARGGIKWIYMAQGVPCPQTARPVYLYVKAWISDNGSNHLAVGAMNTGHGTLSLPASNKWVWARFDKPLDARRVGGTFHVTVSGEKRQVETRLDALVMATPADLTPPDLEAIVEKGAKTPSDTGLLKIGRAAVPPRMDGRLDDRCWQEAVTISPFSIRGQKQRGGGEFAKESSNAYVCYDAKNLYVFFKCFQAVLDPANNQLSAFRKNVTEHDSDAIWKDDCVLVMLDTNLDRKGFFNLMMNGAGALLDERCPPEAPWRRRDKTWESSAAVKTQIDNGYWTVEARIPFSSLGVVLKQADRWGLALGRINMTQGGRGEQTSWQPMEGGFHNAEEFGVVEFGRQAFGAEPLELPELRPGNNTIKIRVRNPDPKPVTVRLGVEVTDDRGNTQREFEDRPVPSREGKELALNYALAAEGEVGFRYYVQNPANLGDYYRSPQYLMRVRSSSITINVNSNGEYALFLNGDMIGQGSKGQKSHVRPLYQGINLIALETKDRQTELSCQVGQERFGLDESWRVAAQKTEGWNKMDFDDSGWQHWDRKGAGDTLLLRKNLLFKQSKLWPPNGGIHVAIGATTTFWHWLHGMKGRTLTGYKFCVEMPEAIELVGATAFDQYIEKNVGNVVGDIRQERITRDGKEYSRYTISFTKAVRPPTDRWKGYFYSNCYMGVRAVADVGRDAKLYYYIETDRFSEVPNSEKIVVYPALNSKTPKHHVFICRGGVEKYGSNPALEEGVVEAMSQCGFTHYSCKKEYAQKYGIKTYRSGMEWFAGLMALNGADPKFRRFDTEGKAYTAVGWCPTLLREKAAQEFISQSYVKSQKAKPFDIADWDMENNPFSGRASCFCRDCVSRFRQFAGLPKDVRLNRQIIEERYREEWIAFECRQVELIVRILRTIIKRHNPATVSSVYSGYQSPTNREHYSIDWALLAPQIDLACCGYGRSPKDIRATLAALRPHGVPLLGGLLLDCPYESMEPPHPHQTKKAEVIRRVLDCRGGVFFMTPNRGMDARSYHAFAETTRFLSDFEGFFTNRDEDKEFVTEKNIRDDDCIVLRKGTKRIVLLLNESGRAMMASIRLAKRIELIEDYYDKRKLAPDAHNRLEVRIAPWDFKALICK